MEYHDILCIIIKYLSFILHKYLFIKKQIKWLKETWKVEFQFNCYLLNIISIIKK